MEQANRNGVRRLIAGQGALLFSGYAGAQVFAFARNALLGHFLSKGDFGTAATITITLQAFETISDVATDRMIVQAEDGDDPRLLAVAHLIQLVRGGLIALVLWLLAPLAAAFFRIEHAVWAFQWIAIIPLIKAATHLDARRLQRQYSNLPGVLIEAMPQAVALALVVPMVQITGDYRAVLWLAIIQAVVMLAVSHLVARQGYKILFDRVILARFVRFGWPILLSAIPLLAVYQGDRALIGRYFDISDLAGYSAAFILTMAPAALLVRIGLVLNLPLLANASADPMLRRERFTVMTEIMMLATTLYFVAFAIAGGAILPVAFGAHYGGLGELVALLALMWALRAIQSVPGALLMASGWTVPYLVAGLLRATSLLLGLMVAIGGGTLSQIAACGVAGEMLSLVFVCFCVRFIDRNLPGVFARRACLLVLVAGGFWMFYGTHGITDRPALAIGEALVAGVIVAAMAGFGFARMRGHISELLISRRMPGAI